MRKTIVFAILVTLLVEAYGCSYTSSRSRDLAVQSAEPTAGVTTSEIKPSIAEVRAPVKPQYKQAEQPTFQALKNPTFDEMIYFLNHNHINWNEYMAGGYTCQHFACDVCESAHKQGIRCAVVHVDFPKTGHAIIAFETTDEGLIYFEPQEDHRMKVEVGRRYWSWIYGPYYEMDYDDTVVKIALYWDFSTLCGF